MAWCPECGAEYREGVSQCAKCGVALADQSPLAARPRLPPFVARRVDEVVAAFGYAVEAVRVLRRHPSLLLLPLGLAVFNEAELAAGSYVMQRHTALGRQMVEQLRDIREEPSRNVRVKVRFHAGPPVPHVAWTGTGAVLGALAQGAEEGGGSQGASGAGALRMWLVSLVFSLLAWAGVNAFVLGGYYGVAREAMATGRLEWGRFPSYAKGFFVRMWLLYALVGPITWGVFVLLLLPSQATGIGTLAIAIWHWVMVGLPFFLAVTPFVIVIDDARLGTAIKRSVLVVARCLTIAVVLILGSLFVAEVLRWPFDWIRSSASGRTWPALLTPADWPAMGVSVLQRCVVALLAAFFPLAMLAWYGRVSEAGATADHG
jgi:hypothetical protein